MSHQLIFTATVAGVSASTQIPQPGHDRLPLTPDELLTTTKTVRRRLDLKRPVSRGIVEECLRLAFQAPNGENAQTYAWIVVDDPQTRQAMAEVYRASAADYLAEIEASMKGGPAAQILRLGVHFDPASPSWQRSRASGDYLKANMQHAPVLVVPVMTARLEEATLFESSSMWGSILPTAWSFMLALRSRGLGSAWTTAHLRREREMAKILGIPYESVTQVGMFPVAYTIGTDFKPSPRRVENLIHWNRWQGPEGAA